MKRAIRSVGYDIRKINSSPLLGFDGTSLLLKKLGLAPTHIVDVGANHGYWTRGAIKFFPNAIFTLVEPQDHLKSEVADLLARGNVNWINAGCGDRSTTLPLVIRERDDSSTFALTNIPSQSNGFATVMVQIKTLDEIVASIEAPLPELVKIDAEGFDLKVLQGARTLLGKTEIFLVEACLWGQENSVPAIINFMVENGYRLLDITDLNRSPKHGVLWLVDLVFVRDGSALLKTVTSYE